MEIKTMLRKVFERYAKLGANSASARGCYEMSVPAAIAKKTSREADVPSKDIRK
ncbi:MAG: hypothetical protein IJ418_03840 [Clostridia bacterium]|nr:hypothetical protein [Clostridia bacterium]